MGQLDEAVGRAGAPLAQTFSLSLSPSLRHACGITPDDGVGDGEHLLARKRLKIQPLITACVDTASIRGSRCTRTRAPGGLTRGCWNLAMQKSITHGCGASTRIMDPCWSLRSALIRYACAWAAPDRVNRCPALPVSPDSLDTGAARATCCALGEATRGHNAVTALAHAAAQSCDCTAGTEVPVIPWH